ncbi:meiosis-specific transcription factor ndt80 [Clydaea vesicula]|uniref:Meiosis-specific transcription factor ndt80 n=1 Tax=Clydaea vesicula TaxID=447962 RepID=A0AAD5UAB5_9FUNG|nr:meiosis-specific transcription factor ndt80 [Clydaea vesicula]
MEATYEETSNTQENQDQTSSSLANQPYMSEPYSSHAQQYYYQQAHQGAPDPNSYAEIDPNSSNELTVDPNAPIGGADGAPYDGLDSPGAAARKSRLNSEAGPFFNATKQLCNLYSIDRSRSFAARLTPRIDRGFFLADNDWTCYRRNYFQVSISYTAVDGAGNKVELPCLVELEGRGLRTVNQFMVGVMARTSNGSREIDLIQHTAKRDKGPQIVPQPKPCEPQDPSIAYGMSRNENDTSHTVIFERLQFKSATANNGKRRAAQQYHVVFAELLARCDDGCIARVASTESAPLVVRGRAPGHYASISGSKRNQMADTEEENYGEGNESGAPDYAQEYQSQQVNMLSAHGMPLPPPGSNHHMSYTAYTAPTAQSLQQQPNSHPGGYYPTVQQEYYYPYADAAVWANAAAAAAQAVKTGLDSEQPRFDYPYGMPGQQMLSDLTNSQQDGEESNGQLPTPQNVSPTSQKVGESSASANPPTSTSKPKKSKKDKVKA